MLLSCSGKCAACPHPRRARRLFLALTKVPRKHSPSRSNSSRSTASRQAITPEESNGIVFPAQSYDLVFQRLANVATRVFFRSVFARELGPRPLSYAADASTIQHRPV